MARIVAVQSRRAPSIEQMWVSRRQHLVLTHLLVSSAVVVLLGIAVGADARPVAHTRALQLAPAQHIVAPEITATPLPPPPLLVPVGWQVYRGHHFALAYPPAWVLVEPTVPASSGNTHTYAASFETADGTRVVAVQVLEGLDATALQRICAQPGTRITFAGLPVSVRTTAYSLRTYVFAASQGTVYTLLYDTAT